MVYQRTPNHEAIMSNQAVGGVYQTIIEEVINSSRVDFEENGVEESVLEELRLVSSCLMSRLVPLSPSTFPTLSNTSSLPLGLKRAVNQEGREV